jgi:hypothetical protein
MKHHMSAAGACWQQLHMSDYQHQQKPTYNPQHDCIGSHWIAGSTAQGVPCVGQPSLCTLIFSTGQPPKASEWQAPADSKANKANKKPLACIHTVSGPQHKQYNSRFKAPDTPPHHQWVQTASPTSRFTAYKTTEV